MRTESTRWESESESESESDNYNNLQLGLCCINTELRKQKPTIFCNRTCRLATAQKKGDEYIRELSLKNLNDIMHILEWNKKNNIKSYRLSSDIFPHLNNPKYGSEFEYGTRYSLKFAEDMLKKIGKKAYEYNIRLSFHPGQYNQIASPTENVFKNTVRDLSCHSRVLDIIEDELDLKENKGIICIHGGGVYNDKEKTIKRWLERFKMLPKFVQDRICIENCEKCYSSEDCLRISHSLNIPHIFDTHHYNCYSLLHKNETQESADSLMPKVLNTWKKRGLKPYFHISEQGSGKIGHHSDYVETIPDYLLNIKIHITIDIEAKAKEQAILKLKNKYKIE